MINSQLENMVENEVFVISTKTKYPLTKRHFNFVEKMFEFLSKGQKEGRNGESWCLHG